MELVAAQSVASFVNARLAQVAKELSTAPPLRRAELTAERTVLAGLPRDAAGWAALDPVALAAKLNQLGAVEKLLPKEVDAELQRANAPRMGWTVAEPGAAGQDAVRLDLRPVHPFHQLNPPGKEKVAGYQGMTYCCQANMDFMLQVSGLRVPELQGKTAAERVVWLGQMTGNQGSATLSASSGTGVADVARFFTQTLGQDVAQVNLGELLRAFSGPQRAQRPEYQAALERLSAAYGMGPGPVIAAFGGTGAAAAKLKGNSVALRSMFHALLRQLGGENVKDKAVRSATLELVKNNPSLSDEQIIAFLSQPNVRSYLATNKVGVTPAAVGDLATRAALEDFLVDNLRAQAPVLVSVQYSTLNAVSEGLNHFVTVVGVSLGPDGRPQSYEVIDPYPPSSNAYQPSDQTKTRTIPADLMWLAMADNEMCTPLALRGKAAA